MTDDGEVVAAHRRRLQMLDAVHAAYGRRSEVLEIVCAAETSEDALLPVQHLLGITPEAQAAKTNLWYPQDARAARGGQVAPASPARVVGVRVGDDRAIDRPPRIHEEVAGLAVEAAVVER